LVLADDRTGALEVAGELAVHLGPVPVVVHGGATAQASPAATAVVVDLGSRHRSSADAGQRARAWNPVPATRRLHKIDSTLRGRWADELVAIDGPVVVVPAFPALGRTCCGGVVHVDGRPLQLDDPRHGQVEARPAVLLRRAGAVDVAEVTGAAQLTTWLAGSRASGFVVCDASTDTELLALGSVWATVTGVALAGTSASLAAAAGAVRSGGPGLLADPVTRPPLSRPALVAVGSLAPVARAQVAALRRAALPGVEVLATEHVAGPVDDVGAERAAAALAAEVRRRLVGGEVKTLLLVGGDTAAAVLGDGACTAGGTVAAGIPWARRADGTGPLVVTKAGGFGTRDTLVELLAGRPGSEAR
jgi:4-hydroxythreonine-4-phosphate dehydrogenase